MHQFKEITFTKTWAAWWESEYFLEASQARSGRSIKGILICDDHLSHWQTNSACIREFLLDKSIFLALSQQIIPSKLREKTLQFPVGKLLLAALRFESKKTDLKFILDANPRGKFSDSSRCRSEQSEIVLLLLFKTCFYYARKFCSRKNIDSPSGKMRFELLEGLFVEVIRAMTCWDFYWFTVQIISNGFPLSLLVQIKM